MNCPRYAVSRRAWRGPWFLALEPDQSEQQGQKDSELDPVAALRPGVPAERNVVFAHAEIRALHVVRFLADSVSVVIPGIYGHSLQSYRASSGLRPYRTLGVLIFAAWNR
jgi:hypothetical protein